MPRAAKTHPPLTEAQQRLVTDNLYFAFWVAKHYRRRHPEAWRVSVEELASGALEWMVCAAQRFDPSRRIKYITFAKQYAYRGCQEVVRQACVVTPPGQTCRSEMRKLKPESQAKARATVTYHKSTLGLDGKPADWLRGLYASDEPSPVERAEAERYPYHILHLLDKRSRRVVELYAIHRVTGSAIGRTLGLSRTRVFQIYREAIETLRRHLQEQTR